MTWTCPHWGYFASLAVLAVHLDYFLCIWSVFFWQIWYSFLPCRLTIDDRLMLCCEWTATNLQTIWTRHCRTVDLYQTQLHRVCRWLRKFLLITKRRFSTSFLIYLCIKQRIFSCMKATSFQVKIPLNCFCLRLYLSNDIFNISESWKWYLQNWNSCIEAIQINIFLCLRLQNKYVGDK